MDSTFTSMADMAEVMGYGKFPIGLVLTQRFDSLAKVASVKAPVLFIHGTSDRFVPAEMSERLYAAAPEPKRLLLVESGNHSNVARWRSRSTRRRCSTSSVLSAGTGPSRARASAGRGG